MQASDGGAAEFRGRWVVEAAKLLDYVAETQMDNIAATAEICAKAIEAGGLVHLFGTGHSRIPVEEMFPRYGSFPGFNPIAELSMTFHTQVTGANGQRQAMFIERVEGLAEQILANFSFGSDDAMIIYSSGGSTAVPIEMAIGARQRRLPVIAVTSVANSNAGESGHSSGSRLLDHADIVIDLGIPVGDALIEVDGPEARVGPGSTISNIAITNEIKVQTAALLAANGALPPVLSSAAVVGRERSGSLFDAAYREHSLRLSAVLAKPEDI